MPQESRGRPGPPLEVDTMGGFTGMHPWSRRAVSILASGGLLGAMLAVLAGPVAASDAYTCGTADPNHPGVLVGNHANVRVQGICAVDAGDATVRGDLTVLPGGSLLAAFGSKNFSGQGTSRLTVRGDIRVLKGGTLILGCIPSSFACFDDATLSSHAVVSGDITSYQPLGVIVHNASIGGDVTERGGGGGLSCDPAGIFAVPPVGPVFSAYEDSSIRGDVTVTGLTSCWLGLNRLRVHGDVRLINNQLFDPDAIEILANHISGDLVCRKNSMVWDNAEAGFPGLFPRTPPLTNIVKGGRVGQCILSSPVNQGDPLGPGLF